MLYSSELHEAHFLKRYKRFFADIEINSKIDVAHVANTGSLKGLCDTPRACRISAADNPERKLKWTLEQIESPSGWVGVQTHRANSLAREALEKKLRPHWAELKNIQSEVKWSKETRFDFAAEFNSQQKHYIEVKSVTLAEGPTALFPDAVTTRGQKHLRELTQIVRDGGSAEILFIIQRADITSFQAADKIDPEYAKLLRQAEAAGVKVTALRVQPEKKGLIIDESFPVNIII